METILYYTQSDDRVINKVLSDSAVFEGVMRDECNIMNPVVRIQSDTILRFNYCYIPDFRRYYSITSINIVRNGIYDVSLTIDVLMSFRGDILQLQCIVDKQTDFINGDEYIDDGSLVCDNRMFNRVYNYPSGFNNYPEYILIVAG